MYLFSAPASNQGVSLSFTPTPILSSNLQALSGTGSAYVYQLLLHVHTRCTVLFCPVPHCAVLCTALYRTALHCTVVHDIVPHCSILHRTALYCAVLCRSALFGLLTVVQRYLGGLLGVPRGPLVSRFGRPKESLRVPRRSREVLGSSLGIPLGVTWGRKGLMGTSLALPKESLGAPGELLGHYFNATWKAFKKL